MSWNREAELLLRNLLARLDADAAAERPLLRGVVSDSERGALRTLLEAIGRPLPKPDPEPSPGLNSPALRLDASPAPEWVLCLDFGTAKSKAFAATADEEELEALPVGQADNDLDASVYEVSSCVWIDDDDRLFVGSEALKRGMNYGGDQRRPLHSLKQEISQVDPDDGEAELARKLPSDVDPTATLTYADVITIYLAYLTDLATTALEPRVGTRYVRRKFTVPSWQPAQRRWAAALIGKPSARAKIAPRRLAQRRWAAALIGKSLLRAQLVADTFHDRWRDGIPVEQVASAVRAATEHDDKLTWMAATEWGEGADWSYGTLEALAAAAARLWTDGAARDLTLVVDVGAGTTDLSLFLVGQKGASFHRAWPIEGGDAGVRQAGDTLDTSLVEALMKQAGLGPDGAGERARRGLRRRGVRRLKEALFETGSITEILVNDETVTLSRDEFVGSPMVRRFADTIAHQIQELLDGIHNSWHNAVGSQGLTLVLTGGGCDLPMITDLKDRQWRIGERPVTCRLAPRVPPELAERFSQEFIQTYPRLAVAMGGALRTRLDEKRKLREFMGGAPPPGPLERYPTKGV